MLYSEINSMFLLGCICNEPSNLRSGKFPLNRDDFKPSLFHYHLFAVINNLALQGLATITEVDVSNFIDNYPTTKAVIEENDGLAFVRNIRQLANGGNISVYYGVVRKFGLLRTAQASGIDISDLITNEMSDEQQIEVINKYSIDELLGIIDKRFNELAKEYRTNSVREESLVGEDFEEVLAEFKKHPAFGAGLCSAYENTLARGLQRGHLVLRSALSGYGKTTRMIADIVNMTATKIYDKELNKFVPNPNCTHVPALYIHTESRQKTEVQPKFIASLADVPLHKILDGDFTEEEEERLLEASNILLENPIKMIDMPEYSLAMLEDAIREGAMVDNVGYVCFDYIQPSTAVSRELKAINGSSLQEYQILLKVSQTLKELAEKYNVGILSSTQLNDSVKTAEVIDEGCLSGSKAIKNKIDVGFIIMPPNKKELEQTRMIATSKGFVGDLRPNMITHVYKSRFSRFGKNLKIFQNVNLGTGKVIDCFVTDVNNMPISIPKTIINSEDIDK